MATAALSLCCCYSDFTRCSRIIHDPVLPRLFLGVGHKVLLDQSEVTRCKRNQSYYYYYYYYYGAAAAAAAGHHQKKKRFAVFAATEGSSAKSSKSEETLPSWAKPDSDDPPPWAQDEGIKNNASSQQGFEIPFFVYLLASAVTAIAAIGSAFEYVNQKPVFGILNSDSIFYAPVLGFFVFTGIPTSAFLWFKSVQAANKEAEEQDKRDGYL